MAMDGTYSGLLASIPSWLLRSDLAAVAPDFVAMAHGQINARLRVRRMIAHDAAFAITGEFTNLPADFLAPVSLQLSTREVLNNISPDAMAERKLYNGASAGKPTSYCIVGDQFQFDSAAVSSFTCSVVYYAKIPALSVSNPTNWLLTERPDVYLYGSLLQSAPFLQDDARLGTWAELFTTLLADIQSASVSDQFGARLTPRASQVA
jgi:hypothetical protein